MAGPITWRTVGSDNPGAGFQPLQAAGTNINNAFDIFSKVLQQRQAVDEGNFAALQEGEKQAYLDSVQGAGTPEELAALQASGALKSQFQALSAANRAVVRPAVEARNDSLVNRQRGVAEHTWKTDAARYAGDANTRANDATTQANLLAPLTRSQTTSQTNLADQQKVESQQRVTASINQDARTLADSQNAELVRRTAAFSDTVAKLGKTNEGVVGHPEGIKALQTTLAGVFKDKDPQALLDATSFVNAAIKENPAFAKLPTAVVEQIVLSRADDFGRTLGPWDFSLKNYIKDGMTAALVSSKEQMTANDARAIELTQLAQRQKLFLGQAEKEAYPGMAVLEKAAAAANPAAVPPPAVAPPAPVVAAAPAARALRFTKEDPALEAKLVKELREQTTTGKIMSSESRQYMQFVQALKAKSGNEEEAKRRAASLLERENPTNPEDVAARKRQLEDRAEAELRRLNRTTVK